MGRPLVARMPTFAEVSLSETRRGDGECVCYDASNSQAAGPAFGGGEVMACDKPLGRITAQLALGIDLICGREPYPAYSHICCDTCCESLTRPRLMLPKFGA